MKEGYQDQHSLHITNVGLELRIIKSGVREIITQHAVSTQTT